MASIDVIIYVLYIRLPHYNFACYSCFLLASLVEPFRWLVLVGVLVVQGITTPVWVEVVLVLLALAVWPM